MLRETVKSGSEAEHIFDDQSPCMAWTVFSTEGLAWCCAYVQGAAITALQTAGPDEINATKMQDEDVGNFVAIAPMALRNKISLGSLRLLMQKVNPCCLWAREPQSKDSSCRHAYPGQVISETICVGLLHFQHFLVCMVPDMTEPWPFWRCNLRLRERAICRACAPRTMCSDKETLDECVAKRLAFLLPPSTVSRRKCMVNEVSAMCTN